MKVRWTELITIPNSTGLAITPESIQPISKNDTVEVEYEGDVIFRYRSFWGTPKFIVAIDDGTLTSVRMEKCRIVRPNEGKEAEE